MHIKNIIISGFRSYREQAFSEELSPKNNVMVGRNGSGKSNFFAAVQFVLSEKFANLRAHERKDLLHVGAGRPVISVYVEIVFDNSDGRLVIPGRPDENEVRIRRTLGLKQDEFRVNDRKFSSSEVRQLLESAGFSAHNPYYIVEQGKIVHLANMREEDRYELLKDVAGTKVYEARREESERILEETSRRHTMVKDAIAQLDHRLKELDGESAELKAYQEIDRRRKSVEYCIYNNEQQSARDELDKMDANWNSRLANANHSRDKENQLDQDASIAELAMKEAGKRIERLDVERKGVEKERAALAQRLIIIDLKCKDAVAVSTRDESERRSLEKEMSELEKALQNTDLAAKKKLAASRLSDATKASDELLASEMRLQALQAKRGRKGQFKGKADRDKWIHEEIKRNDGIIASTQNETARLKQDQKTIELQVKKDSALVRTHDHDEKVIEEAMIEIQKRRATLITSRDKLNSTRRHLWQKMNDQEGIVKRTTDERDRCRQRCERAVRLDIRLGLNSLAESLREINDKRLINAVHGQIVDLLSVEKEYTNAVDVIAGNALYNVVVDSFDVSAQLLDHMNKKKKPGRVTFFPLDTCKTIPRDIGTTKDYSPLISHVTFEKKFMPVFAELLGRTAVVSSVEVGATVVKDLGCDAVTMDGDQFNRKGGITGGFVDKRFSKITANVEMKGVAEKLSKDKAILDAISQEVAHVEKEITAILHEIEQLNTQDSANRSLLDNDRHEHRCVEDMASRMQMQAEQFAKAQESLLRNSVIVSAANEALRKELATEFQATLTAAEETDLENVQSTVTTQRAKAATLQTVSVQSATDTALLQDTVRHLERRTHTVRDRIRTLESHAADNKEVLLKEKATCDAELRVLEERLALIEKTVDRTLQERTKLEDKAQSTRNDLLTISRDHQKEKDVFDRAHGDRALLVQKKEVAQGKIRRLGIIPGDADKFSANSIGKLMAMLKSANDELRKYAHVNKKAIDQYTSMEEMKIDLVEKHTALVSELDSIRKLLQHLDVKKEEAVERTYKQVQFHFEEVFKELVATKDASAELQLVSNTVKKDADPYTAVRVKVSFGMGSTVTELAQLSGGQKSLVALSLIFAIQRCDPAPFYLFDEIDAALDADYRTSVAALLRRQSENCQFITATFKNEMLESADKVLGIIFHNKVSRIQFITLEEGQRLLKMSVDEERKRGRETEQ